MKQSAVASLLLLVLLLSVILFSSSFVPAEAANAGVYIQADGTVQGTSSIQRNGDLYTFVGDLAGPLYVGKDNVAIDGAGHTLTGGNGRGVVLADRHNVTLKNARVTLDGGYVIDVQNAIDCALIGNTLIGTPQPIPDLPPPQGPLIGPIGVNFLHSQRITVKDNTIINFFYALSLEWSSGHTITGNTLVDGILGIALSNTTGCVFRNNRMNNSGFSIQLYPSYHYENDLDSSNTVDGKPIYYWVNTKDTTVPSGAAYIVLVRCANMLIENASPHGIALASTSNSTISRVKMTGNGDGIDLLDCSGISILDSILSDHAIGIQIENSSNNIIRGNKISNYITRGINLANANNNLISNNIFTANSYAIASFQDSIGNGNTIASNNFTKNEYAITVHGSMEIMGNLFEENNQAILLSGGSGSTITQNSFTNNKNALYFSDSSGNSIYLNNFLKNDRQFADAGVSSSSTQPTEAGSDSIGSLRLVAAYVDGVNFIPPPPPSSNQWDNGAKGNYWIDYNGSDKNGDSIGDTPYYLYENNQDRYPLMNPVSVSGAPAGKPPENVTQTDDTQAPQGTPEPELPIEYVIVALAAVVGITVTAAGGLLYFKKRNHAKTNKDSEIEHSST
jgi:parallel beta-helix repeat protein